MPVRDLTPILNLAYRAVSAAATPLIWLSAWRVARRHSAPAGTLDEKMGRATLARPEGPLIWLYGTGLGELIMAKPVVDRIVAQWPGVRLLVTSKNRHYEAQFRKLFPDGTAFQSAPFETPAALGRFCAYWRPDFVLWVRKNPTPNAVAAASGTSRGFAILQAELGDRAFRRQRLLRALFAQTYGRVPVIAVRSDDDAARYNALGAPAVLKLGDLRNYGDALTADADELARLRQAVGPRPAWVAASTRDDEYLLAGRAHRALAERWPGLLTVIAPRHPGFGARSANALRAAGFTVALRSAGEAIGPATEIYMADTLGELGLWYQLCPIAFVGGTFARKGGHNVLEPARLGCAVLCGPDVRNIAAIAAQMVAARALREVASEAELVAALAELLDSAAALASARAAAAAFTAQSAMTIDRIMGALRPHLTRALAPPQR